eukprot:gnl/Chilomastix_cuspidata/9460.p2 GENE.gnl/Chilomastix_cuspidata/9460~~gnl/Chilomastix_cuspidata/9460.p2  ORF type:complete len:103 (+),score=5.65 gnl/Chilomastix_cuspidata/9460:29-337(+)
MKIILKYLSICIIVLSFASDGGGGGSSSSSDGGTDTPDDNTDSTKTEIVSCLDSSNIEEYTSLQSDDEIVKDSEETVISIYHDSDGNKKICVESGSAYILTN